VKKPREAIVQSELYRLLKNYLLSRRYQNVDVEPEKVTPRGNADLVLIRNVDGKEEALLVIEVKSPKDKLSVYDEYARKQAEGYAEDLNASYYAVTNGLFIRLFRRPNEDLGCYCFELSDYCIERFLSDFLEMVDGLKERLSLPNDSSPEIARLVDEVAKAIEEVLEGLGGREGFHLEVSCDVVSFSYGKEACKSLYLSVGKLGRVLHLDVPYPKAQTEGVRALSPYIRIEVRALREGLGAERAKELLSELSEVPGFEWIDDRDFEKKFIYHNYFYEYGPPLSIDPTKMKERIEGLKQGLRGWLLKLSELVGQGTSHQ